MKKEKVKTAEEIERDIKKAKAREIVIKTAEERASIWLAGLIDVEGAAFILDVSARRVRDFLLEGRLKGAKLGRIWLIKEEDVINFSFDDRKPGRPSNSLADSLITDKPLLI